MKTTLAIALVMLASSNVAFAEEAQTVVAPASRYVERVSYDQSELSTQSGVHALKSRVILATRRICAPTAETFAITYNGGMKCERLTQQDAFAQIDLAIQRRGVDLAMGRRFITIAAR